MNPNIHEGMTGYYTFRDTVVAGPVGPLDAHPTHRTPVHTVDDLVMLHPEYICPTEDEAKRIAANFARRFEAATPLDRQILVKMELAKTDGMAPDQMQHVATGVRRQFEAFKNDVALAVLKAFPGCSKSEALTLFVQAAALVDPVRDIGNKWSHFDSFLAAVRSEAETLDTPRPRTEFLLRLPRPGRAPEARRPAGVSP